MRFGIGAGFAACVVTLFSGCKTTLDHLVVAPEFSSAVMSKRPLAVAGVVDRVGKRPEGMGAEALSPWENEAVLSLASAIQDEEKSWSVWPGNQVSRTLASDLYGQLMGEYRTSRKISGEICTATAKALGSEVWLILASLESDQVTHARHEGEEEDVKTKKKTPYVEMSSTRRVGVEMSVYDLATCKETWFGKHAAGESRTERSEKPEYGKGVGGFLKQVASVALNLEPQYPEPPPADVVARGVFKAFAENLPKKEK